ncbi:hypothetical protein PHLCEN_2v7677 [Hermanssonia centrifuga]|uniref:RNase H type-1 domain-containing protein n=1 Tax=Hermanssonia centrifuga TaxID=98765 RepID=A0A2R6NVU7_9APHY|nr:hypothetical protein PHLCEN_2v7677 [Hermanssonia centrifuga]
MVDHRLYWKEQVDHALNKGMKWVALFRRMAAVKKGVSPRMAKRLYFSIALPSMLYAADVFLIPQHTTALAKKTRGSVGPTHRLSKVHRQALLMITGGMRTTATDTMEAHSNVLPFHLLINKMCHQATVRLCTLPLTHPLAKPIQKASRRYVKRHRSALHELFQLYRLSPEHVETLTPARYPSRWNPHITLEIAENKEEAEKDEEKWKVRPGIRIYTDGSDFQGGVGASAALYNSENRTWKTLRYYLGTSDQHTVYEAEIVGLILGMQLLRKERHVNLVSFAVDNQAALQASRSWRPTSGHYLMDIFHGIKEDVRKKSELDNIFLRWVPGHNGIEGNELADEEAKLATGGEEFSSSLVTLPKELRRTLPLSAAKLRQVHNAEIEEEAQDSWMQLQLQHFGALLMN